MSILEMKLMTGCYFVRRLYESGKLPDALLNSAVPCVQVLPRKDARPHRFRSPIDFMDAFELFDFGGCTDATVSVRFFANQFIHSEVLVYLGPDEATGESIAIVASDTGRRKRLLCAWLNDIADIFERAAITEPTEWSSTWNADSESYVRTVPGGELDDRLVQWGYVSAEAMEESVSRMKRSVPHRIGLAKYLGGVGAEVLDE